MTNILFLLKKNDSYGNYSSVKYSGLINATKMLTEQLEKVYGLSCEIEVCVDANEIDKYVTKYKPDYCVLEALWVTPEKMKELVKLHSKLGTMYITRIHSNLPFLANEGTAIDWLSDISKFSLVATNNLYTHRDFDKIGIINIYLPNIYKYINAPSFFKRLHDSYLESTICDLNIGCFGSVRPLKNQLIQACAAIAFADKNNISINFHMNGERIEQTGEPNLKNIKSLFKNNPKHTFVEHGWLEPDEFSALLRKMDISMQVSFTESFNIVSADAVYNHVPIVVSKEIEWAYNDCKTSCTSLDRIVDKLEYVTKFSKRIVNENLVALSNYNKKAIRNWSILY